MKALNHKAGKKNHHKGGTFFFSLPSCVYFIKKISSIYLIFFAISLFLHNLFRYEKNGAEKYK